LFKSQSATPFWHQANRKVEIDMYEEKRSLKKRKRERKRERKSERRKRRKGSSESEINRVTISWTG